MVKDLTHKNIKEGVACIGCATDHFMTASALLDEAARMAIEGKGFRHKEVAVRVGDAKKELDVMERVDLSPKAVGCLKGSEKKIAKDALRRSGKLRHDIMGVSSIDGLISLAKKASNASDYFWQKTWGMQKGPISCPVKTKHVDYPRGDCKIGFVKNPKRNRCVKACRISATRDMKTGRCKKVYEGS